MTKARTDGFLRRIRRWPLWLGFSAGSLAFVALLLGSRFALGLGLSDSIYLATGFVLLWYTIETQGMRREIVRQNHLSVQPLLLPTFQPAAGYTTDSAALVIKPQLAVRNIGKGPALSVSILEVPLPDRTSETVARFSTKDCIEPGQAVPFEAFIYCRQSNGWKQELPFEPAINPRFATEDYDLHIHFADIIGGRHECVVRIGKSGITLLGHGRVE